MDDYECCASGSCEVCRRRQREREELRDYDPPWVRQHEREGVGPLMVSIDNGIEELVHRMVEAQATEDDIGIARSILNGEPYYERVHPDGRKTRYELITPAKLREAQEKAWDEAKAAVERIHPRCTEECEMCAELDDWLRILEEANPYRDVK